MATRKISFSPLFGRIMIFVCLMSLALAVVLPCKLSATENDRIAFSADNPPCLENFVLAKNNRWITLSLTVRSPFDKKLKSLILNGVPQKITLEIITNEKKNYLFLVNIDRKIFTNSITHSIHYDNLKKLFVVNADKKHPPLQTSSYQQALTAVSTFNNIHLLPMEKAQAEHGYQAKVKAEIVKKRMPFHLEYLFFFLAGWERKTQTYVLDIPQQFLQPNSKPTVDE
ncbi:MAG: hypothetical protein DRH04_05085 [Deltaproteobacteria bacterium]|nr:MAG: hypothetical protein DRH04_05085 [Deltaproteobacteria bacterium]